MHKKLPWLKNAVLILGSKTLLAVDKSIQALLTNDIQAATEVRQLERLVDSMYHGINEYCLDTLASGEFPRHEVNFIVSSLKIAMELERISDYANQIAKLVQKKLSQQNTENVKTIITTTSAMRDQTLDMLKQSLQSYEKVDVELAKATIEKDSSVDKMNKLLFREMLCLGSLHPWVQEVIMDYHVAIRYIERVADRTTNISELVYYIVQGHSLKSVPYSEEIWNDN